MGGPLRPYGGGSRAPWPAGPGDLYCFVAGVDRTHLKSNFLKCEQDLVMPVK